MFVTSVVQVTKPRCLGSGQGRTHSVLCFSFRFRLRVRRSHKEPRKNGFSGLSRPAVLKSRTQCSDGSDDPRSKHLQTHESAESCAENTLGLRPQLTAPSPGTRHLPLLLHACSRTFPTEKGYVVPPFHERSVDIILPLLMLRKGQNFCQNLRRKRAKEPWLTTHHKKYVGFCDPSLQGREGPRPATFLTVRSPRRPQGRPRSPAKEEGLERSRADGRRPHRGCF